MQKTIPWGLPKKKVEQGACKDLGHRWTASYVNFSVYCTRCRRVSIVRTFINILTLGRFDRYFK